jgi:hypothetical protein
LRAENQQKAKNRQTEQSQTDVGDQEKALANVGHNDSYRCFDRFKQFHLRILNLCP